MSAPWRSLSSSPVEAILESLYLVVIPKKREDWTIIDFNSFEKKIEKLETFSTQLATKLREEGTPEEDEGYMSRMLVKVLDNL